MRIVAVADTHGFQADLGTIPDGDVFVHAGDMLRSGSLDELAPVARWLHALPHARKIVIAGNHDWCFARDPDAARAMLGDDICYLQDSGCTLDGLRFWGTPWQPEFFDWAFNLPRGSELAAKWALIPDETDVLISHGPPRGFGDRVSRGREGCDDLLDAIRRVRPALHMFGHIHEDGGIWRDGDVCIANVTTWDCGRGATVVDIDTASGAVSPIQIPPPHRA